MAELIFFIDIAIPALILLVLHYFPWPKLFGGRELHRLESYAIGVATIIGVPYLLQLYAGRHGELNGSATANLFIVAAISAGAATLLAWGIDALIEKYHHMADERDRARVNAEL